MPAPLRFLPPNYLIFVSSRIEEGLPFVATRYMEAIIESVLARAQTLYPVTVCDFIFMPNHPHFLFCVKEPSDIVAFMDYVKTETAHAINRLLGRQKRTVWCDGYDAEPILTLEDAIKKIVYIYTNPQTGGLTDTIDKYPGVSSWPMLLQEQYSFSAPWIQRPMIEKLSKCSVTAKEDMRITAQMVGQSKESFTFKLSPFAWLQFFGENESKIPEVKAEIISRVRDRESEIRRTRTIPYVGAEALRRRPINLPYTPKKFGRRMWCICHDKTLRKAFIGWVKELRDEARRVFKCWKHGDQTQRYPFGLFPPSLPKVANIVPRLNFDLI